MFVCFFNKKQEPFLPPPYSGVQADLTNSLSVRASEGRLKKLCDNWYQSNRSGIQETRYDGAVAHQGLYQCYKSSGTEVRGRRERSSLYVANMSEKRRIKHSSSYMVLDSLAVTDACHILLSTLEDCNTCKVYGGEIRSQTASRSCSTNVKIGWLAPQWGRSHREASILTYSCLHKGRKKTQRLEVWSKNSDDLRVCL